MAPDYDVEPLTIEELTGRLAPIPGKLAEVVVQTPDSIIYHIVDVTFDGERVRLEMGPEAE